MMGTAGIYAAAIVLALVGGAPAAEQSGPDPAALRARIERRFDVLPLRGGCVLWCAEGMPLAADALGAPASGSTARAAAERARVAGP